MQPKSRFTRFAHTTARISGHVGTFITATVVIVIWAVTGPLFHFSDTWQLVINTGTTIVTFLMVFLIQNTQNRDSQAVQIKLDELIRAIESANNSLLDLEDLEQADLDLIRGDYENLAEAARKRLQAKDPTEAARDPEDLNCEPGEEEDQAKQREDFMKEEAAGRES
ncbi:MAG TPA: low affinity iron permease family protein [Gemmatimonadales bacterium]|jgi:low affinity Fe/Cu permease|nr:low affinity iron permease family protein [Gemmatimonadales bacterium]